jgi:uncharacterized protein (DUF2141 family)
MTIRIRSGIVTLTLATVLVFMSAVQAVAEQKAATPAAATGKEGGPVVNLVAVFHGLRNDEGMMRVSLYKGPTGYPRGSEHALAMKAASIKGGEARVVFEGLVPGEYAVSAFHDEDSDKKIRRNFIGIPVEGIAASNDARNPVGPPKYMDAKFMLGTEDREIRMKLQY